MSEDTPEKVEEKQVEEPLAKKKVPRKRSKAPEPKGQDDSSSTENAREGKIDGATPSGDVKPVESEKTDVKEDVSVKEARPPLEDGETPTENPSIRRISSKRKKDSTSTEADESPDQVATMAEPPAADSQGKKRRRRRRKGSGSDGDEGGAGDEGRQQSRSAPRVQLDPDQVTKKAWKIFLSEVSEEGLALVSDQDAKEIGRRSFRLAEIFLEESAKRQRD